ncbi:hypothetical protein, partial [Stenotrophomonas sp. YIM B06876]|uniref:hypothetical protein n=1 Tax=Stenotrophomonas sp. YIM B06876 TaxID=3060211 RepID=UPI00273893D3
MSNDPIPPFSQVSPPQLSGHFRQCFRARGPWHRVECAAEALHGFLAQRFVTSLVFVAGLAALAAAV